MYIKITKNFKNTRKLKSLLKDVYKAKSNHLESIGKLRLKDDLIPSCAEKIEIEIKGLTHHETIIVPKSSLTFLTGNTLPFTTVKSDSNVKDKYIVLPWNLETEAGRAALKSLIDKIPSAIRGVLTTITYALYINADDNINQTTSQETATATTKVQDIVPISTSHSQITSTNAIIPKQEIISEAIEDFSWTGNSFTEDNEEKLLDEIEKLKKEVETLQSQARKWTVELLPVKGDRKPNMITNGGRANIGHIDPAISVLMNNVQHFVELGTVIGSVKLDIDNHRFTIIVN